MKSRMTITFVDYSGATTSISFDGEQITQDNFSVIQAKQIALCDGLIGIVRGAIKSKLIAGNLIQSDIRESDNPKAYRKNKWRIVYQESNGKIATFTIGTADLSLCKNSFSNGKTISILPIHEGAGLQFKTAFEDYVTSDDGRPVKVMGIDLVS